MMLSLMRKSDLVWLPWKNGAGVMADIACAQGLHGRDPDWRVSMARVERDSPFSHYADTERGMMLIEGERLDLLIDDDAPLTVRAGASAVVFPGDQPTRGVPVDGAIVNLNVMVRRDAMRQRMIRWTCDGPSSLPVMSAGKSFAYVQRGRIALYQDTPMVLEAGDTLITDAAVKFEGTAELIEINIWPA